MKELNAIFLTLVWLLPLLGGLILRLQPAYPVIASVVAVWSSRC